LKWAEGAGPVCAYPVTTRPRLFDEVRDKVCDEVR